MDGRCTLDEINLQNKNLPKGLFMRKKSNLMLNKCDLHHMMRYPIILLKLIQKVL